MENKNNNKQVQVFNNGVFGDVRVVMRDSEPWFVGKDVASALGYSNPRKAILDHVKENHKMDGVTIRDSIGREQNPVVIDEAGVYSLVMRSKLPQAEAFQEWVTSEVLPTIRKQGMYLTSATAEEAISDPDTFIAKALIVANQVLERQKERIKHLETTNNALTSTISTTNVTTLTRKRTCATRNDMTVREVSKLLGVKQTEVYSALQRAGWFMRAEEGTVKNVPTLAAPADCFYIEEYTYNHKVIHQVKVTKAGLLQIKVLLLS